MTIGEKIEAPLKWLLIGLVRAYQLGLSPLLPPMCRFYPSCSQYALDALRQKRLLRALGLIIWRLLRCQPLCRGGYDPVK
jgi:putative membrane protein insertion efficiency factor